MFMFFTYRDYIYYYIYIVIYIVIIVRLEKPRRQYESISYDRDRVLRMGDRSIKSGASHILYIHIHVQVFKLKKELLNTINGCLFI